MVSNGSDQTPSPEQPPADFKTEFHPCSNTPSLFQSQEEFGQRAAATMAPDPHPWCPFIEEGDYLFAEIALQVGLNASQINGLLSLISRIVQGKANVTLWNDVDLQHAWDRAAMQVTPFTRHNVTAPYKGENLTFPVYACSLWEWALDLLSNPLLAPHFVWDAQQVFQHNGHEYERFYSEPWTGDRWWDIQSHLPQVENAALFAFILYADQTRLSSHGTVKGYPVVARCGNLPMNIRNGECFGGGCVVSWLPIVPESTKEEGKTGYTNYKHVIWHEAFLCIIDRLAELSKLGYKYECYDKITRWLFPLILILSADYEEQCMMSLIRGMKSKCPCPVCLVPLEELSHLAKSFPTCTIRQAKEALTIYQEKKSAGEPILKALRLRPVANVFWKVENSELEEAVSFDRLHALHDGLFGHHSLEELKILLSKLPCKYAAQLEEHYADGNKLRDLVQQTFYAALNILTNNVSREGYQLLRMLRSYLELDSLIGLDVHTDRTLELIEREQLVFGSELKEYVSRVANGELAEHLKTDWNFPKVHLWKHVVWDIQNKGAAHNYSTRPNEKMHGSLKDAYQDRSNGKDVAIQVLRVDHHCLAMKLIRNRVDAEANRTQQDRDDDDIDDGGDKDALMSFSEHVKLGSPWSPKSIQSIIRDHASQQEFQGFHQKFTQFINQCLPIYLNRDQHSWKNISFAEMFQLQEHAYLKVNYKSRMDWWQATDYLRCNPSFHSKPRYDTVLFQLSHSEIAFACLVFMFSCNIPDFGTYQFALVRPYTANINAARSSFNNAFRLTRVKARPHTASIFIPIRSIVRGALLYPDPRYKDKYFVVEHIDGDMFRCVNEWNGRHQDQE
ncbi:hypothetical protein BKA82DRAFT_35708 [Pisolithus tinctorius]|uniref:Uncharacterized protein n=1 Tax=Pisolithus tinctorius Marx 270 TaxID=870435 RepID=A0A0C3NE20_PISTI|nr:hypothetical protein BKA82DRAFT_35708 [Pisolithus tinctorius]KIN93813.1 hypothetical protein M404DRAFT_35708 [Pisolithus tinctorius Marx 270]